MRVPQILRTAPLALLLTACGGATSAPPAQQSETPQIDPLACVDAGVSDAATTDATTAPPPIGITRAFPALSFDRPVAVLQAPGDSGHWYVVEQAGQLRRFAATAGVSVAPIVLDLSSAAADPDLRRVDDRGSEKGLLGLAFHPDFPSDPRVYLSYTGFDPSSGRLASIVASLRSDAAGASFDTTSLRVLLSVEQPFSNHNGGHIAFGPDDRLYVGLGDGGSSGDPQGHGQNCSSLLGGMLRIDVDATPAPGSNYAIPPGNPFVGTTGGQAEELFAWGLRNPWRWSFDRDDGRLWVGDVGQGSYEEVGVLGCGENHGWRLREGLHAFSADSPNANCPATTLVDPRAEYDHASGDCSVTGGYVYRGAAYPELRGVYLYADFCSGRIRALRVAASAAAAPSVLIDTDLAISSFGQANDGELYLTDLGGGGIYRIHRP